MPWDPNHKDSTRVKILKSAASLFAQLGFANVGINEVMEEAGLTRGAFYAHFKSKAQLYEEAMVIGARDSMDLLPEHADLRSFVEGYLSEGHRNGDSMRCPLAFLASDVGQRESKVRNTYTKIYEGFVDRIEDYGLDRETSLRTSILMIGGVAIARALNDDKLIEELFEACRQVNE